MRDEVAKCERGYKDPRSIVRSDGTEKLVGKDWALRKVELRARCEGRCERLLSDGTRCRNEAADPHHMKARSKGRDDRLANLIALCRGCHNLLDWKRITLRDLQREQSMPRKCVKHPKAVWFDGYLTGCRLCKIEAENDFSRLTEDVK